MKEGNLFKKIRQVVSRIPPGKVATYGQVALLAGTKDARKVGWALFGNQDAKIPCHRVVRADGSLAPNYSLEGWRGQKRRLLVEGVKLKKGNRVDLNLYRWRG